MLMLMMTMAMRIIMMIIWKQSIQFSGSDFSSSCNNPPLQSTLQPSVDWLHVNNILCIFHRLIAWNWTIEKWFFFAFESIQMERNQNCLRIKEWWKRRGHTGLQTIYHKFHTLYRNPLIKFVRPAQPFNPNQIWGALLEIISITLVDQYLEYFWLFAIFHGGGGLASRQRVATRWLSRLLISTSDRL